MGTPVVLKPDSYYDLPFCVTGVSNSTQLLYQDGQGRSALNCVLYRYQVDNRDSSLGAPLNDVLQCSPLMEEVVFLPDCPAVPSINEIIGRDTAVLTGLAPGAGAVGPSRSGFGNPPLGGNQLRLQGVQLAAPAGVPVPPAASGPPIVIPVAEPKATADPAASRIALVDPFIVVAPDVPSFKPGYSIIETDTFGIYLKDTQPLIYNARYRYLLVRFDSKTHELVEVIPVGDLPVYE